MFLNTELFKHFQRFQRNNKTNKSKLTVIQSLLFATSSFFNALLSKTIEIIILKVFWLLDISGKDIGLSIKIHNSLDVQK